VNGFTERNFVGMVNSQPASDPVLVVREIRMVNDFDFSIDYLEKTTFDILHHLQKFHTAEQQQ
jgi:hypothetical protein